MELTLEMDSNLKHRVSSQNMKPFLQRLATDRSLFSSREKLIRYNSKIKLHSNSDKVSPTSKTFKMPSAGGIKLFNNHDEITVDNKSVYCPPFILPPIYSMKPLPFQERDTTFPTPKRGPVTEKEWLDLRACRYLRPRLYPMDRHRRYRKK